MLLHTGRYFVFKNDFQRSSCTQILKKAYDQKLEILHTVGHFVLFHECVSYMLIFFHIIILLKKILININRYNYPSSINPKEIWQNVDVDQSPFNCTTKQSSTGKHNFFNFSDISTTTNLTAATPLVWLSYSYKHTHPWTRTKNSIHSSPKL